MKIALYFEFSENVFLHHILFDVECKGKFTQAQKQLNTKVKFQVLEYFSLTNMAL
jgi:hypothetical protein